MKGKILLLFFITIVFQKEWLQYHLKETKFVEKTFINNGYLGSKGSVSLGMVIRERIRERTMQLFEYRYLLDGEVEFLYHSKKYSWNLD